MGGTAVGELTDSVDPTGARSARAIAESGCRPGMPTRQANMSILALHPDQIRILVALQSAARLLNAPKELTIVGGLARFLAGQVKRVGDVDVLISSALCKRYWDFLEILSLHGIISVWDVLDRPAYRWEYCMELVGHARALTSDCESSRKGLHRSKLDIVFAAADLDEIPHSSRWMDAIATDTYKSWDDANKGQEIAARRVRFQSDLKAAEQTLTNIALHADLGLLYAA